MNSEKMTKGVAYTDYCKEDTITLISAHFIAGTMLVAA